MDFQQVWDAYPEAHSPCSNGGMPAFENQCAIRLGACLHNAGVDLSSFRGAYCWFGHTPRHTLRAEELKYWLTEIFGAPEIRTNADWTTYLGRRGIIFCRNFWGEGNQGDHIDLWNRELMKTGSTEYIGRSREVWFWDLDGIFANLAIA